MSCVICEKEMWKGFQFFVIFTKGFQKLMRSKTVNYTELDSLPNQVLRLSTQLSNASTEIKHKMKLKFLL